DIAQATANINDKTTLKVLTALSASPRSAHPLPDGSFATASSPVTLIGKAPGKMTVSLDRDGDGFDDGNVKAAKNGTYSLPATLSQINLSGDATSLAVDSRLHIAAVATGPAGLQLVNVADPTHPTLLQTIGTDARAVAIVDGIAYVATAAGLESYDLLTAEQLQ